jgi:hypothetical protein
VRTQKTQGNPALHNSKPELLACKFPLAAAAKTFFTVQNPFIIKNHLPAASPDIPDCHIRGNIPAGTNIRDKTLRFIQYNFGLFCRLHADGCSNKSQCVFTTRLITC